MNQKTFKRSIRWAVAVGVGAVAAGIYWTFADWHVYVGATGEPKFELPLQWRIFETSIVGCVVALFFLAIYWLVDWSRAKKRAKKRGREFF